MLKRRKFIAVRSVEIFKGEIRSVAAAAAGSFAHTGLTETK